MPYLTPCCTTFSFGTNSSTLSNIILQSAVSQDADIVIIDTAERLHNKVNLMNELTKVKRVMQKVVIDAPHEILSMGYTEEGQPRGLTFIGKPFSEALLLQLAAAYEKETRHRRMPMLHGE